MQRISILALVAATIFDFIIGWLLRTLAGIAVASHVLADRVAVDPREVAALLLRSPTFLVSTAFVDLTVPIAAGYIAARLAKRSPLLHGALAPSLRVGLVVYYIATGMLSGLAGIAVARAIVPIVLAPLLGLAGGWLGRRKTHTSPGVEPLKGAC